MKLSRTELPKHARDRLWPEKLAVIFETQMETFGLFFSFKRQIEPGFRIGNS